MFKTQVASNRMSGCEYVTVAQDAVIKYVILISLEGYDKLSCYSYKRIKYFMKTHYIYK